MEGVQLNTLNTLHNWCYKWRLCINNEKTKIVHFRPKAQERTLHNFDINGVALEIVSEYKYLGVLLDEHLDYEKTAELLSSAAGRALGGVINKVKWNKDLGYKTYTRLIDSCVVPIILYASGVWGQKLYKCCEDVILRACRYYMGVHRLTPIPGIQGDMGWLNCKSRWALEAIRLYNRLMRMDCSRLDKRIFNFDKERCRNNWSASFKKLLDDLDLTRFWNESNIIPLDLAENKLWDRFKVDWEHQCRTKPKLRTYIKFKNDVNVANHISCNMSKYERSLISQLRLGILPLRIETGRYSKLLEKDRICLLCNQVEDEYHFRFQCELYNVERTQPSHRLNVTLSELTEQEKLNLVFEHPFILGKFVRKAMKKRREKMYR